MLHKSFDLLEVKADGETGEFTALVSTFGNVDKVGDRIVNGAYTKTLAQRRESGDPLPIILAHQWDDVMAHVGYANAENIQQTPRGLLVNGKLDVEDNPVARQVYKLMKRRTLKEFSIGYSVPTGGEKRAKDGANEITEIELAECGPCLKGIDPKTELHAVKSALADVVSGHIAGHAEDDPAKELEQVKAELAAARQELDDLKKQKAEEADKETKSRSVDPLRRQADAVELEFATDGLPKRAPTKVEQPKPELMPIGDLKQRMRDEMLMHLSGETT